MQDDSANHISLFSNQKSNPVDVLRMGVSAWIIQDGNYGDFRIGDHARCALEFFSNELLPSSKKQAGIVHVAESRYWICGEIIYSKPGVLVVDFGFKAFREAVFPDSFQTGTWVEGEIYLGIDPFFYKEYLWKQNGMPDLFYDWSVRRIELNCTPWVSNERMWIRDESKVSWSEISSTDAWHDDDGQAEYILHLQKKTP